MWLDCETGAYVICPGNENIVGGHESIYIPIKDTIWMSFVYFGLSSKFSKKTLSNENFTFHDNKSLQVFIPRCCSF